MDPYQNLANAIVLQAVRDYRSAMRRLRKNPQNREAKEERDSLLRFFHSRWYSCLTDVNPEYLLERLDKEVQ